MTDLWYNDSDGYLKALNGYIINCQDIWKQNDTKFRYITCTWMRLEGLNPNQYSNKRKLYQLQWYQTGIWLKEQTNISVVNWKQQLH